MASSSYIVIDHHDKVSLKSHPDNFLIDSQSGYGIDIIRKLISWSQTKPFSRTFKVVVIAQANTIGVEAQNALLKTLEEPSPHTTLILTTPQETMLLPTIISRCQRINSLEDIPQNTPWSKEIIITTDSKSYSEFPIITSQKTALHAAESLAKTDRSMMVDSMEEWGTTLSKNNTNTKSSTLKQLIETKKHIAANGNIQLNLEILFLHIAQNAKELKLT